MLRSKVTSTHTASNTYHRYLVTIFIPLFVLTLFCFGYSEYRIKQANTKPTGAADLPLLAPDTPSDSEALPPISTSGQSTLPVITVGSPSSTNANIPDASSTTSQIPDNGNNSNPQVANPSLNLLQSTIDRSLYLKYLHQSDPNQ